YRRECSGRLYRATFLTLPRAFFLFLVELKTLGPFLCPALLPFARPDSTNPKSHFSLVFDTPNSFAVSSAVANFESRTIVILILSFYDTLIHPRKLGGRFILMIPPSTKLWRHWVPQPSVRKMPLDKSLISDILTSVDNCVWSGGACSRFSFCDPEFPHRVALWNQSLTKCKFHKSFLFIFMQLGGGRGLIHSSSPTSKQARQL